MSIGRGSFVNITIVLIVFFAALICLIPNFTSELPRWWGTVFSVKSLNLGLDLRGGTHLVLEVDKKKLIKTFVEQDSQKLFRILSEEVFSIAKPEVRNNNIIIPLIFEKDKSKVIEIVNRQFVHYKILEKKIAFDDNYELVLGFSSGVVAEIIKKSTEQALEIIRNRVDFFGVSEPEIMIQEGGRILVQFPGLKNPQRVIDIIKQTAQLEFMIVEKVLDIDDFGKEAVPPGKKLAYFYKKNAVGEIIDNEILLLKDFVVMTGESIEDARVKLDSQYNEPYVLILFNLLGTRQFAEVTTFNVKKRLAILLDGKIQSAPIIQEPIVGGRAFISGNFTMEEARDLAVILRSGSLPAPIKILEKRVVGPSLGYDSIRSGIISILIALFLVTLFISFYYRIAGVVANLGLFFNLILVVAILTVFQATLTLPGIAGIILMVGMVVDANVLIFERIREEKRRGDFLIKAIEKGYNKAIVTILDANVTTLIAALVLFQFGTGPIKGFAITLCVGIVTSMFTSVYFTRIILIWLSGRFRIEKFFI